MDVSAFPRYTDVDSATGYTLLKPSNIVPDWMRHLIGSNQLDLSFDNLLRKALPGLPADPNYVRKHGVHDTINNMDLGFNNAPIMDIGNFERDRPIFNGSRTLGMENPGYLDKNELLEKMLKHSSDKSEELKAQIKKIIVKEAQNMAKISMLSEEFKKTVVKNKNNTKLAGALTAAGNYLGLGYGAGAIGYGGYKGLQGHPLDAAQNIGLGVNALSTTPFIRNSLINSPKAFSRLSAFGAPFAAAETLGNIKDVGADLYNGNGKGAIYDGTLAGLNGSMAYTGARQGAGTLRSAYNMAQPYLRNAGNFIRAEAPNYMNAARGIGSDVANFASAEAPNYMNAARTIATNAGNTIRNVAPGFTEMGATAGNTAMPEIIAGLGARAAAIPGVAALASAAPVAGRIAGGVGAGYGAHSLLNMIPKANENTYMGQVLNNFRDTAHDIGTGAATGAGSFGPGGAIPGAIAGGVYNLGRQGYNAYQNGMFNPASYKPLNGVQSRTKVLQNALNVNMKKNIAAHNAGVGQPVAENSNPVNPTQATGPAAPTEAPETYSGATENGKLTPTVATQLAQGEGQKSNIPPLGSPNTPVSPPVTPVKPSEAMGGASTPDVIKMSSEVKTSNLKRRNTGIGDWVNPKDFEYLSKSAAFNIISPEEYADLPLHPKVESIHEFFFPQG